MITAITAGLEALRQVFSTWQAAIQNQSTSSVISDKRRLKKASNYAEEIIAIVDKYENSFEEKDKKRYNNLKEKFFNNN